MSACYGAWELKTDYQRNFSLGLVCSLLLSSGLFLTAHFFNWRQISLINSKKHTIRVKLFQPLLRSANSSPVEPVQPLGLSTQTPKEHRLMKGSPIQTPILEWPHGPRLVNHGLLKTSVAGVGGNAEDRSDSLADAIIDLDEFDLKPVILFKVAPKCPDLARRGRITGTVTAQILVGRNGLVQEVSIKNSSNVIFDEEVLAALKLWVFRPWVERNRSFPFRFTVMVEFVLR